MRRKRRKILRDNFEMTTKEGLKQGGVGRWKEQTRRNALVTKDVTTYFVGK